MAIIGPRINEVGIETIDPITKPVNQALIKMGVNPTITTVIVKDIISDNDSPIRVPVMIGLCFSENLIINYITINLFLTHLVLDKIPKYASVDCWVARAMSMTNSLPRVRILRHIFLRLN